MSSIIKTVERICKKENKDIGIKVTNIKKKILKKTDNRNAEKNLGSIKSSSRGTTEYA